MTVLKHFFKALNEEEARFLPRLAADNLGLFLRCAINELDWYYYNLERTDNPSDEQEEQYYILQLGVTRIIKLALDARGSFDVPVVTFRRCSELTIPVLGIVSALGIIQHGRRVAQTIALGVGKIEEISEKQFVITLPEEVTDDDFYERTVLQHYNTELQKIFAKITRIEAWHELEAQVNSKLHDLVYPFEKHFIGYGGDPLLDDFFFGLAYKEIRLQEGFDTFHYSIQFGGICFQSYILALTFLVSMYIRHERFAESLVKKEPNILLENILTITSDTESFIKSVRDAVNYFGKNYENFEEIDLSQARSIFKVLSCSRANSSFIEAPGSPLPLIVQSSDAGFIRCLTGAHTEPVRFLLESLRYHYPKEYDENQKTREASLQRAVQRLLNDAFHDLKYHENVLLKLGSKILTDIDLAVFEECTGVVILCQLKHQELYGFDLHAKRIRSDRLKSQVKNWLAKIDEWIADVDESEIRKFLRLPRHFPKPVIYKMIISRHFSYPLKDIIIDNSTVYANWLHFFNANELVKRNYPERSLQNLINILKEVQNPPENKTHLPEPTTKWTINELSFVTSQRKPTSDENQKEETS